MVHLDSLFGPEAMGQQANRAHPADSMELNRHGLKFTRIQPFEEVTRLPE
jgi:hypothetical protein